MTWQRVGPTGPNIHVFWYFGRFTFKIYPTSIPITLTYVVLSYHNTNQMQQHLKRLPDHLAQLASLIKEKFGRNFMYVVRARLASDFGSATWSRKWHRFYLWGLWELQWQSFRVLNLSVSANLWHTQNDWQVSVHDKSGQVACKVVLLRFSGPVW